MNGLVGHHEALADVGLGPCSGLVRSKLDLADDKTAGVSSRWRREGSKKEGREEDEPPSVHAGAYRS